MAEYVPVIAGQSATYKASAPITAGQLVAVSGVGTVAPAGADAANWLGVAAFDAGTNDNVTVHWGGVQEIVALNTVTAGEGVEAAATGKVATQSGVTALTFVGVALSTATDAKVRVRMAR